MRNYSFVSVQKASFLTVNTGDEYYSGDPGEVLAEVLMALSEAFETPLKDVKHAFGLIWTANDVDGNIVTNARQVDTRIPPSELSVLVDLHRFFYVAKQRYEDSCMAHGTGALVFSYSNLNTGRNVVWSSIVC